MNIKDFKLERYFAKYEFTTKYLLSSSDCDGFSLEYILEIADLDEKELWKNLHFGYTDSMGSEFLRYSISKFYDTISINEINVITPGEANFILMNTVLNRGDEVVCIYPAYQSLYEVAKSLGADLKWWKIRDDGKYYVEDIEELITKKTKILIINFPHNPTGFIPTYEELRYLIEIAQRNNIFIFSDEMYKGLVYEDSYELPSVCDLYENSAVLWGMSKSFGLAGLRIGWLCSHRNDIMKKVSSFKDYLSICNNAAGEVLAYIALNHSEDFIGINKNKIKKNKNYFNVFCSKYKDLFEYNIPKGGSTALVKQKTGLRSLDLCESIVEQTGVMIIPSEMFDFGNMHIRIGFGRKNFVEALNLVEEYLSNNHYI